MTTQGRGSMSEQPAVLIRVSDRSELVLKPQSVIGRQQGCDVLLTQGHASRRHARVLFNEEAVWLEDLGSANGSYVNDQRITGKVRLASGDRLRFDVEEFDIRLPGAMPAALSQLLPMVDGNTPTRIADSSPRLAEVIAEGVREDRRATHRPGAWADPDAAEARGNKTAFIEPEQLKQMMALGEGSASGVQGASQGQGSAQGQAQRYAQGHRTQGGLLQVEGSHLQVLNGSRAGLSIRLASGRDGAEWSVDSQSDCEVRFQDSGVSALHARLINDGLRWKLLDQMSANGTFVNGQRSNVSYLASGDRLRFGPVECIFHADEAGGGGGGGRLTRLSPVVRNFALAAAAFLATVLALFVAFKLLR